MRKTNVMEMKWEEVDLVGKIWHIPMTKNGRPLVLPLAQNAVEILQDRKKLNTNNSPWVFASPKSLTGHIVEIKESWKYVLEKAGLINLHIHDLRRSLAVYLLAGGASTAMVMELLGHRTLEAAQVYLKLSVNHLRGVLNQATNNITSLSQR